MNPTERLLERLEAVKPTGERRWQARCPAHDDRTPSLSVTEKPPAIYSFTATRAVLRPASCRGRSQAR